MSQLSHFSRISKGNRMGLRMKSFNVMEVPWKIQFLHGGDVCEKPIYRENCLKKGSLEQIKIWGGAGGGGLVKKRKVMLFWGGRDWCPNAHYVGPGHKTTLITCNKALENTDHKHYPLKLIWKALYIKLFLENLHSQSPQFY